MTNDILSYKVQLLCQTTPTYSYALPRPVSLQWPVIKSIGGIVCADSLRSNLTSEPDVSVN